MMEPIFCKTLKSNHANEDLIQPLVAKYNIPVPRYTSYPPVPKWNDEAAEQEIWKMRVKEAYSPTEGISLYIHLPYCESLCTYCGCNTRITKNHTVEVPYMVAVLNEWALYLDTLEVTPVIAEIHIGGGTPTFFSAENLRGLMEGILSSAHVTKDCSLSIEAHPSYTSKKQLEELSDMGFRRISFGIQDFDMQVQKAINRIQTFEEVKTITELSRKMGFNSINYDLVYGLPFQTIASLEETLKLTLSLKPDRIAFYSYAHVPWKRPSQRGYSEENLPESDEKFRMNVLGRKIMESYGYVAVGMDHFALPNDSLSIAAQKGNLHRNFMGYTDRPTSLLIGLGASSISDSETAYTQNVKTVETYLNMVAADQFPIEKMHTMTGMQQTIKQQINNVMCNFKTEWTEAFWEYLIQSGGVNMLQLYKDDQLLNYSEFGLQVTPSGKFFVRNICTALDQSVEIEGAKPMFSSAV